MTRDEIKKMMKYFQVAYPGFYAEQNIKEVVDIWEASFGKEDSYIVKKAAVNYVNSNERQPTIAGLRKQIDLIKNPETETDLWALIKKAASNGIYGAEEEFEKLPEECQSFIGSPASLRELAQCDAGTMDTVVKGQFLKRVESIKERQDVQSGLPIEVRQVIAESVVRHLGEITNEKDNML